MIWWPRPILSKMKKLFVKTKMPKTTVGCRTPVSYFITKGKGQNDYGSTGIPYEGGSYDKALTVAGISNFNILTYSSMIPPNCRRIDKKLGLDKISFGCVLETIKAEMNGTKGQEVIAALLLTKILDPSGKELVTFVLEYGDNHNSSSKALELMFHQLKNMIQNRGFGTLDFRQLKMGNKIKTSKGYIIQPQEFIHESLNITKNFGSVVVVIAFTEFTWLDI